MRSKRRSPRRKNTRIAVVVAAISVAVCVLLFLGLSAYDLVMRELYPTDFAEYVDEYSREYGIPRETIFAVIRSESGFDPEAISSAGACGLMQLMPATFGEISEELGEEGANIFDPRTNIKYGTYYLRKLFLKFADESLVIAAYNAGPGRVSGWLSCPEYSSGGRLVKIPISETEKYVKKTLRSKLEYKRLYE